MGLFQVNWLHMYSGILAILIMFFSPFSNLKASTGNTSITNKESGGNEFGHALWVWATQTKTIGTPELHYFITNLYNHPLYAAEYLPNTFCDIVRFLSYGNDTYKNRTYMQQVIRLFYNKIKSCRYINPQAFSSFIDELPKLLERHCIAEKPFAGDLVEQKIHTCIQQYIQKMTQTNSASSLPALSKEIVTIMDTHYNQTANTTTVEELRKSTHILCELCLAKLVWAPEEGIASWQSTKKIAHQLSKLLEASILTDADDLNDLFVTLAERYSYFMEIMANELDTEFFTALQSDLKDRVPLFLDFQEQEPVIEPKLVRFNRSLAQAQATHTQWSAQEQLKRHAQELAQEHGIVMHPTKLITAHGTVQLPANTITR